MSTRNKEGLALHSLRKGSRVIYLRNTESCVLILDDADLARLRTEPMGTPDGRVLIGSAPDLPWVSAALQEAQADGGLTPQKIVAIIATARAKADA